MRIDVTKCECDVMLSVYDVIHVPRVMTSIIVVMVSIERVAVMSNIVGEMSGIVVVFS